MVSPAVLRRRLLELHKALIDAERRSHEKTLGRLSGGEFLDALINDPLFAWLAPLTAAIARLDDIAEEGETPVDGKPIRELLSPNEAGSEFQRRYADFLQHSPEVLVAHGAALHALKGE